MFDFLLQRNGTSEGILQVLTSKLTELNASRFAIQKCVMMISNAVAKSEILIQGKSGLRYDEIYYKLNIRPNPNESGTEFWSRVSQKLLTRNEALIVRIKDDYYLADSWLESSEVLKEHEYSNVSLSNSKGDVFQISKRFKASDVIHLRLPGNANRTEYLINTVKLYDEVISVCSKAIKLKNIPKHKINIDAAVRLVEKSPSGTDKQITGQEYAKRIVEILSSDDIASIVLPTGVSVESIGAAGQNDVKASDLEAIVKSSEAMCARAFDIPSGVYFGTIADNSDATNEFITYAVAPVVECINDSLTAALVGIDDFVNQSERIMLFVARYKHIDIIDSADKLSKMRGDGWTLDEIFHLIGYPELHTEFTSQRTLTKNYEVSERYGGILNCGV